MQGSIRFVLAALLAGCFFGSTPPPSAARGAAPLKETLAAVVPGEGHVAVSVLHFGTGERASIEGGRRMPMMSVFKLPLAVVALSLVDEGKLALDASIPIAENELRPGVSPIAEEWAKGRHAFDLETILARVIQDSDNTAGDKLVTLEGGGAAITAKLRALGLGGIDIAEQEIEIFARTYCPGIAAPPGGWTFPVIDRCPKPDPIVQLAAMRREIDAAPNGASSDALVHLLEALERGTILSKRSRDWLHETLAATRTGKNRIKGWLPPGTRVEHKSGTGETIDDLNVATNDVGIVTLPDGQRFAIAILTAGLHGDDARREDAIAKVARAAWDRFSPPSAR